MLQEVLVFWFGLGNFFQNLFESLCMALLEPTEPNGKTHEERIDEIRRQFPKTKTWLDWWTMADVKAILFPSRRKMLEDCPDGEDELPSSTNAQESMHRVYYMFRYVLSTSLTWTLPLTWFEFMLILEYLIYSVDYV